MESFYGVNFFNFLRFGETTQVNFTDKSVLTFRDSRLATVKIYLSRHSNITPTRNDNSFECNHAGNHVMINSCLGRSSPTTRS